MNNHDDSDFLIYIVLLASILISFVLGGVVGSSQAEKSTNEKTRKETVNYCITSPEKCKIEYEFYKLQPKSEK